jgi:hypothetical protein
METTADLDVITRNITDSAEKRFLLEDRVAGASLHAPATTQSSAKANNV